jgi:hypothetical protein
MIWCAKRAVSTHGWHDDRSRATSNGDGHVLKSKCRQVAVLDRHLLRRTNQWGHQNVVSAKRRYICAISEENKVMEIDAFLSLSLSLSLCLSLPLCGMFIEPKESPAKHITSTTSDLI